MPLRKSWFLVCLVSLGTVFPSFSQSFPRWQRYNESTHGVDLQAAASLSFSATRQNLWVTHIDRGTISKIDGYKATSFPAPELGDEIDFRVYEGDSGQLWALHPSGVQSFSGTRWERHVIGKVQQELRSSPQRRVRQIPLLPAEQNSVLILLSDQLIKYDSRHGESVVLLDSADFAVGDFIDLLPARDMGLWITAEKGVLRILDEYKRTDVFSTNIVHRLPEDLALQRLQSPFESTRGLGMMADGVEASKYLVTMEDGVWSKTELPVKQLRRIWMTPDGRYWGLHTSKLYQWTVLASEPVVSETVEPDIYSDVVVDSSGAFFVSGPNGVWRYAPSAWRKPLPLLGDSTPVRSFVSRTNGLWFLSGDRLIRTATNQWSLNAVDLDDDGEVGDVPQLAGLADGRLLMIGNDSLHVLDPVTGRGHAVSYGEIDGLQLIGMSGANEPLLVDASNQLHFFTKAGLTPWESVPTDEDIGRWSSFVELAGGGRMLGATAGMAYMASEEWQVYSILAGDLVEGALAMAGLGPNNVWIGGATRLQVFNGGSFSEVNAMGRDRSGRAGLDRVNTIRPIGDGEIWVSDANGIWVERSNERNRSWSRFNIEDGLPRGILTLATNSDGGKWVGTSQGVFKYHEEVDRDPPQTFITDSPDGREVSEQERINFAFVGMDKWQSSRGGRLLYSYRFDDGEWSQFSEDRSILWNGQTLGAGTHSFGVRSMDVHGNIDPLEAIARFDVVIPWWRVTRIRWVVGFAAVAVVVFAGLAVNRHLRLMRSYAEIEKIVDERTRQLERANRELAHAEKMRSLGTLAAGVAHDFNSILSIIRGSVQIIEANKENTEKVQTRVNRIKSMVEQGSTLVKSMLGFSRADDAGLTLENVGNVVEETIDLLGDRLPKAVNVTIDAAGGLPTVHGNRELLQQIIVNLVLNAVDAMEGEGSLIIRAQRAHQLPESWVLSPQRAREYVIVTVEDNGCGITAENLSRIFEPFYTTKAFSTRHGTGLGLSMVYEFCKELGYGLSVRSQLHRGTLFSVVIPVFETVQK